MWRIHADNTLLWHDTSLPIFRMMEHKAHDNCSIAKTFVELQLPGSPITDWQWCWPVRIRNHSLIYSLLESVTVGVVAAFHWQLQRTCSCEAALETQFERNGVQAGLDCNVFQAKQYRRVPAHAIWSGIHVTLISEDGEAGNKSSWVPWKRSKETVRRPSSIFQIDFFNCQKGLSKLRTTNVVIVNRFPLLGIAWDTFITLNDRHTNDIPVLLWISQGIIVTPARV